MTRNRVVPDRLRPIAILGVTASGKSSLAMRIARARNDVELVSVDSMQVYRGMDIGTAKPTTAERSEIRHHGLDIVDPWEPFDVAQFRDAVGEALSDIATRGRRAVLVGGTGLYLRAIVDDLDIPGRYPDVAAELAEDPDTVALHERLERLDPAAAAKMQQDNRRRIIRALEVTLGSGRAFSSYGPGLDSHPRTPVELIGLDRDRDDIRARIETRFHEQMRLGFLDEVRRLLGGPPPSHTASQALGYKELIEHLETPSDRQDAVSLEQAVETAIRRIRRFAVRQERWFRRDPRIIWYAPHDAFDAVMARLEIRWGDTPS